MRVRKIYQWLVIIVGFVLSLNGSVIRAESPDFDITEQQVVAEIQASGNVSFVHELTYEIENVNGFLITIDYGDYDVLKYRVGIKQEDGSVSYFQESNTGEPMTFGMTMADQKMVLKAYYPAKDQRVQVVYDYILSGAVTSYLDTAELNRRLIGSGIDFTTDVQAKVILPGLVSNADDFRAWAHGAPQGTVTLGEEDGHSVVLLEVPHNPAGSFVEVHTIFPLSMVPNNTNKVNEERKNKIIAEEEEIVAQDKAKYEEQQRIFSLSAMALMILGPIGLLIVFGKYRKQRKVMNPNPIHFPHHVYELPDDITPAVMKVGVLQRAIRSEDIAATIADLARKGYIRLDEDRRRGRKRLGGQDTTVRITRIADSVPKKPLHMHEKQLLKYLLPEAHIGATITLESLESSMASSESFAIKQYSKMETFQSNVKIKGEQLVPRATGQNMRIKVQLIGLMVGFWLALMGLMMAAPVSQILTVHWSFTGTVNLEIWLFIVGGLQLVIGFVMLWMINVQPIKTAAEDKMEKEWQGFANMLQDIGHMEKRELGDLALWEEYLVYAISLGLADKVIEAMKVRFNPTQLANSSISPQLYNGSSYWLYHLSHSLQSGLQVARTSHDRDEARRSGHSGSNSGGFGGGFSSGTSGGSGGGGGAGAF